MPKITNSKPVPEVIDFREEVEVEEEVDVVEEIPPYEDWSYEDLKAESAGRNLSRKGTKDELVQRLYDDDAIEEDE